MPLAKFPCVFAFIYNVCLVLIQSLHSALQGPLFTPDSVLVHQPCVHCSPERVQCYHGAGHHRWLPETGGPWCPATSITELWEYLQIQSQSLCPNKFSNSFLKNPGFRFFPPAKRIFNCPRLLPGPYSPTAHHTELAAPSVSPQISPLFRENRPNSHTFLCAAFELFSESS